MQVREMMAGLKRIYLNHKYLIWILFVAWLLRVIGFTHDQPIILGIDEPTLVRNTTGLRFSPFLDKFDWPHYNYYFHFIFYWTFIKFRAVLQVLQLRSPIEAVFPIVWNDPFVFYAISRFINGTLGALVIIPTFLLTEKLINKHAAYLAVLIYAFLPFQVNHSHQAVQDTAMLFWLMWGAYFALIGAKEMKFKKLLYASIFFGLGTGVKYNGILFTPLIPIFLLSQSKIRKGDLSKILSWLIALGVVFVGVFVLTTPGLVVHWEHFWSNDYAQGVLWQFQSNLGKVPSGQYIGHVVGRLDDTLIIPLGVIPFGLWLVSIWFLLKDREISRPNKLTLVLLYAYVLGLSFYTFSFKIVGSRFFIYLYALISIYSGYSLGRMSKNKFVYAIVLIPLFVWSSTITIRYLRQDTLRLALEYYEKERSVHKFYYADEIYRDINAMNSLGIKKLIDENQMQSGDYIITVRKPILSDKIVLIDEIDNKFRYGPTVYVYRKN